MSRIFFVTPDINQPSGGVSMIYDHVINLNKLGHQAFVVHFNSQFKKIGWRKFGKDIAFLKAHYIDKMFDIHQEQNGMVQMTKCNFEFKKEDIIVVPEGFPQFVPEFKQKFNIESKIVMFAQGWLYVVPALQQIFRGQVPNLKQLGVDNVIGVGTEVIQYMKDMFGFEDSEMYHIPNFVDTDVYNLEMGTEEKEEVVETEDGDLDIKNITVQKTKKNKIAFMPRKGMEKWYGIIISLAIAKGLLKDWEFVPIVGLDKEKVSEVLKESKIFLNFTEGEGFGLPALESILCGCVYVGNAGLGGLEFLDNSEMSVHSLIQDCNNPYEWVDALESAMKILNHEDYETKMKAESEKLASIYNYDNFVKALKETYSDLKNA